MSEQFRRFEEDRSKFFNAMETVVKFVCSKIGCDTWEEEVFGEDYWSESRLESISKDESKFKNAIEVFRLSVVPGNIETEFGSAESFTESLLSKSIEERKEVIVAMNYIIPHLESDDGVNLWSAEGVLANIEDVHITKYVEDDSLVRLTNLFISIMSKYFYPIAIGGKIYHSEKLELVCSMGSIIDFLSSEQSKEKWKKLLTENGEYSSQNAINSEQDFYDTIELFGEIAKDDLTIPDALSFKDHLRILERTNFIMTRLDDAKEVQEWQSTAIPSSANYEYFFRMAADIEEFIRIVEVFIAHARKGFGKFVVGNELY